MGKGSEEVNQKEVKLRQKFIRNGIPYDELDVEMVPVLDLLNFQLGIETKFCCYGHKPKEKSYIMFGDQVEDSQIQRLVEATNSISSHRLKFFKWMRKPCDGDILNNWILEIENYENLKSKEKYHRNLLNKLKMIR
jgi:hypothetical protein